VISLVAPGDAFKTREILAAIQDAKRHRVHFRDRDVEVGSAFLGVAHQKPGPVRADFEFRIDRPDELRKLLGRHFLFRGNAEVPDAVTAAFDVSYCLGVVQGVPVAREDFDTVVLVRLVE